MKFATGEANVLKWCLNGIVQVENAEALKISAILEKALQFTNLSDLHKSYQSQSSG